jgi:hypothetical protein
MFKFATSKISIPQVWKSSFNLYKQTLKSIWYLIAVIQLVPVIFAFGARLVGMNLIQLYIYFAMVASSVINLYIVAVALHRMHSLVDNTKYRLCDSFKFVGTKFLRIIVIMIGAIMLFSAISYTIAYLETNLALASTLMKIPFGIALAIILIALIFLSLFVLFTLPLILFKNASILDACKKSVKLVSCNWWRTFLAFLVPLTTIMFIRKSLMIFGFKFMMSSLTLLIAYTVFVLIVTAVLLPYLKALILVQFNDLLHRKSV